jgi:glycosyltransferase involved in cell wall biosynthesis
MENKFFFTLIVVTLNAEKFLADTLNSIVNQSFKNFQLIVKDALSKDLTVKIAKSYPNITLIEKRDNGIYDAMNQSLVFSKGKYIIFMNAGDTLYNKDVLKELSEILIDHEEVELIYGNYYRNKKLMIQPNFLNRYFLYKNIVCHQTVIYSDSLLKMYSYNLNFKILSDYDLFLKIISRKHKIHRSDLIISNYLGGGVSESKDNQKLFFQELNALRKKYFSPYEILFYNTLNFLTLQNLRRKLTNRNNFLAFSYYKIVNFINKTLK